MRILFVAPYVPSLIRVRPFHFLRELGQRHEIDVLAVGSERDLADVARLRTCCRRVEVVPLDRLVSLRSCAIAAAQGDPLQSAVCRSPAFERRLDALLAARDYDLVHLEHLRAAHVRTQLPQSLPAVFDAVDCISLLLARTLRASASLRQRLLALAELRRTRAYEARLLRWFDRVAVTSAVDGQALRALAPSSNADVVVVPNGVDLDYFQPAPGLREPATLVFSGKMSYHANATAVLHFVREILPLIRRRRPDVRLRIAGSNPPAPIQALARDPAITVTGYVPDIRAALGSGTIAICPVTVKVGIQNKVLEAMAMGLPVVSTEQGAEGLAAEPGCEFLVAGDPAAFAGEVCRLLAQPALRDHVGRAGRRYVERYHRWDVAARQLETLYREAINLRTPAHAPAVA